MTRKSEKQVLEVQRGVFGGLMQFVSIQSEDFC